MFPTALRRVFDRQHQRTPLLPPDRHLDLHEQIAADAIDPFELSMTEILTPLAGPEAASSAASSPAGIPLAVAGACKNISGTLNKLNHLFV